MIIIMIINLLNNPKFPLVEQIDINENKNDETKHKAKQTDKNTHKVTRTCQEITIRFISEG